MFVHGRVNASLFGVNTEEDVPSSIMTTDTGVFFNSLGRKTPVVQKAHLAGKPDDVEGYAVWKAFLNRVPSEMQVQTVMADT